MGPLARWASNEASSSAISAAAAAVSPEAAVATPTKNSRSRISSRPLSTVALTIFVTSSATAPNLSRTPPVWISSLKLRRSP